MKVRSARAIVSVAAGTLFLFIVIVHWKCLGPDQGCVNQGKDRRRLAPIVCCLQRHLSWNSEKEPHFALMGRPGRTSIGVAWPPYLVFNFPKKRGRWIMFRIGFRYDRNWRGYIFPTLALKDTDRPLRY